MKGLIKIIFFLFITQSAYGLNLGFLKNSVIAEFSQEEAESFREFVQLQLGTTADQNIVTWKSDSSNLGGKLKPKFTFSMNGLVCRRTAFLLTDQRRKEQYIFDVCNTAEGWEVTPTPVSSFRDSDWRILEELSKTVLEVPETSAPFSWFNTETRNSGVVVPLSLEQKENGVCRELAISISDAEGVSSNGVYLFCKSIGMDWERVIDEEL